MNIQKELNDWAKETVEVYNRLSTGFGYYTQTPLNNINKTPDLLILGINPGYGGGKEKMTGEELLKGNPCFESKDALPCYRIGRVKSASLYDTRRNL